MIIHLSKMVDSVMYTAIVETKNWHLPSLAGAFSINNTESSQAACLSGKIGVWQPRFAKVQKST